MSTVDEILAKLRQLGSKQLLTSGEARLVEPILRPRDTWVWDYAAHDFAWELEECPLYCDHANFSDCEIHLRHRLACLQTQLRSPRVASTQTPMWIQELTARKAATGLLLPAFLSFDELPEELRLLVWRFAAYEPQRFWLHGGERTYRADWLDGSEPSGAYRNLRIQEHLIALPAKIGGDHDKTLALFRTCKESRRMALEHSSVRLVLEGMPVYHPWLTPFGIHSFDDLILRNPLFKHLRYVELDSGDLQQMGFPYSKLAPLLLRCFPAVRKFTLTQNKSLKMLFHESCENIQIAEYYTTQAMRPEEGFLEFWLRMRGSWENLDT